MSHLLQVNKPYAKSSSSIPYVKPSSRYGRFSDRKDRGGKIAKIKGRTSHIDAVDDAILSVWDKKTADDLIVARGAGTKNPVDGAPEYSAGLIIAGIGAAVGLYGLGSSQGWWGTGKEEKEERERRQESITGQLDPMLKGSMADLNKSREAMLGEGGFFDQQLGQQHRKFDLQEENITEGGIVSRKQAANRAQQANAQIGQTGLAGSGAAENLQRQLTEGAYQQGTQRQFGRENIEIGRDMAETAAGVQRSKYETGVNQQFARMVGDYMSATGEALPDDLMQLFEEYTNG